MAKIKDVYSNDEYYPFLLICEKHGCEEMADLQRFPFQELRGEPDLPPRVQSMIKAIFVTYGRTHTAEFSARKKPVRKAVQPAVKEAEIEQELEIYFESNADRLVKITDISKSLSQKVKRCDLLKILERMPCCKAVDAVTFFYSPQD